ncbi:MAG TPA: glycosyltransferase [Bacteroidetes bacterium]|nr:glycosyltransferase [Bacteroidota bacterium]
MLKYFDIINLHWIQTMLSNEAISYICGLGKPVIWTLHDMNPFTGGCHYSNGCCKYETDCADCPQMIGGFSDYPERILRVKERYWDNNIVIVSPSQWLADCARRSKVFRNNRIKVIKNGVDTGIFRPTGKHQARSFLGLPTDKKILLFTCQSHGERRKGFKELLEIIKNLFADGRNEYHVIMFGRASDELGELPLPYTGLGHIDEEWKLALGYSSADVTLLPTLEDNLPNVILESVSCGTPVVAFDSGGVRDAVVNNVTGYLIDKGNCALFAEKIKMIVTQDYSDACRSYALQHFDLSVQARKYCELIDNLTYSKKNSRFDFCNTVVASEMSDLFERLTN